ncbi:hypothetical protein [Leucobacter soli]|uniref:hypothetical protein n=1 Tax=Leucobacter soli TaxID=2812850 RepID=UPI0036168D87
MLGAAHEVGGRRNLRPQAVLVERDLPPGVTVDDGRRRHEGSPGRGADEPGGQPGGQLDEIPSNEP